MAARPRTLSPAAARELAADFLARRRAMHGDATMTAPTGEQQTTTETTKTEAEPKKLDITQAELDRIIGERVSAEQGKWQKKLEDAQALAGKNETEKLTIERDQAKAQVGEVTKAAAQRIARTEAKVAAQTLGAKGDRLRAVIGQADLTAAVDDDGNVDESKVEAAIKKVLDDYPEWRATTSGPSQSGGELNGGGNNGKPTFTRKQLEEMPPEEMAARIDEINEAIADGRVTG